MSTEIHALAGAYALDAVDDVERAAFRRHLGECETCAMEVTELRETVGRLADSTWAAPPPRLRETVLREISRTRQIGPGRVDRDRGAGSAAARWRRWTAGAVAAGVIAVGAGATTYVVQENRVRDAQATAAEAGRVRDVLTAPDAVVRRQAATGGGEVSVVTSASRNAAVALLSGMPAPDARHAYQLWLIDGSGAKSAGLLAAGRATGVEYLPGVAGFTTFGVSLEPASGSAQPTPNEIKALVDL